MRVLVSMLTLTLLLAACGGGENTSENAAEVSGAATTEPGQEAWLVVEARGDREDFDWYINGKQVDAEGLKEAMQGYGDKTDSEAGLKGRNADGISANPMLFTAAPGVTSQAFLATLETLVRARMYRMRIELAPEGGKAMREWVELPMDQGFGGPTPAKMFLTPERTGDSIRFVASYEAAQERGMGGIIPEDAEDGEERESLPRGRMPLNVSIATSKLHSDGFDMQLYRETREALTTALQEYHQKSGGDAKGVEVAVSYRMRPRQDEYPRWGTFYLQIDAVERAEIGRTTFKFADALGSLRND